MAQPTDQVREGYIAVTGGRVWYQIVGSGDGVPLLVLHGGPGFPHYYLETLEALSNERPVIFYDQLGCGKSDRPDNPSLWRVERFVEEVEQVRKALGLERFHLLGHSWGTMLATEYVATQPQCLVSLTLASPVIDIPYHEKDMAGIKRSLPEHVQEAITQHEADGTIDSKEYQDAMLVFYRRYFCRLDLWPKCMYQAMAEMGRQVYYTMVGFSELNYTGNLKGRDDSGLLREITIPTLFTCGRYDIATPEAMARDQSLLPGSEMKMFEKSSHMPHLEETEAYLQLLREFLRRNDRR